MEDSESAEKQENTGMGAASACLLILRSAHAEDVPRIRRSGRASRRMRTCDWVRPHASSASQRIWAGEAPALAWCCDAPQHEGAGAKHQLAAVRDDRRRTFIVSGLLFTMTFATPTCWPHRALKTMPGDARADVPSGAAVTFEPVVH